MAKLNSGERCKDCKYCKVWSTDYKKASCEANIRPQGFHPDSEVPAKCIGTDRRKF